MQNANEYRIRATVCRGASKRCKRPNLYLLDLADHYDRLAADIETQFAGSKPAAAGIQPEERK
jgi:hypothetical protein